MGVLTYDSPEFGLACPDFLSGSPVFLVSSELPGCGSTTLAGLIARRVSDQGYDVEQVGVGDRIRETLGVKNERDFADRLGEIDDPSVLDPQIYGDLPTDRVCVVDGKLATTVGPRYLGERPHVRINLKSDILTSAKRILQREGLPLERLLTHEGSAKLLGTIALLGARASHDRTMAEGTKLFDEGRQSSKGEKEVLIDTSAMSPDEIEAYFSSDPQESRFKEYVPEWELSSLRSTLASLAYLRVVYGPNMHPNDQKHFEYQYNNLAYNLERLGTTLLPEGIEEIRSQIRKSLVDCWFGLMMKEMPRFFQDVDGGHSIDSKSQSWSPEYYKIAEGWPLLSSLLRGQRVLDPFGGAGTLVNLLASRGIVSGALVSDISYPGGVPIDQEGHVYDAEMNAQMANVLFDDLPSWYKPNRGVVESRFQSDARKLPLRDGEVDYIVTDPPYGKNHNSGGLGLLIGCLPEFQRVTRSGSVLLLPTAWPREIQEAGYPVVQLSRDVSKGVSNYPVCYILVGHKD